ncbi:flavin monoamine oxidase family protein [Paenibacillus sp. GCM10027628]|uniref:flavin monoamine oxidase family protein n=1 Tax=Paenibacillus sp. GCM10027628 TaxID=3273413 RepID=UPI00363DC0BC
MARTRLFQRVLDAVSIASESSKRGISVEKVSEERMQQAFSRREFLRKAVTIGAIAAIPSSFLRFGNIVANAAATPRIAIVGAGLAGLTCAYRLKQAGLIAQVYEASSRIGGRCWTRRGDFANGQIAEHGGELIDQNHTDILQLSQELGLNVDDVLNAEPPGTEDFYYVNGARYSLAQFSNDLQAIWQQIHSDYSKAASTQYNNYTARGWELDHMSVRDWINQYVPGGVNSNLGKLLDLTYTNEFGAPSTELNALNLIWILGPLGPGQPRILGKSNGKYHVHGGNDQIPQLLAQKCSNQISTGYELIRIKKNSDSTYTLTFKVGIGTQDVIADHVVLALPFSILRNSVDFSNTGFSQLKQTAITQLGMGVNAKLQLQFTERSWYNLGCTGGSFSDTGYQDTWEVTRAQAGSTGILVEFAGADVATSLNSGTLNSQAIKFLQQLEPVLPGITAKWNGMVTLDYWPGNTYSKGSYSYYRVGQTTLFAGYEGVQEGNCHFAGEHTSSSFQGFLNGAVESGQRAASEIIAVACSRASAPLTV